MSVVPPPSAQSPADAPAQAPTAAAQSRPDRRPGFLRRMGGHFWIAATLLLLAVGWWQLAKNHLRFVLSKEPVPWPASVQVTDDFRLASLPVRLGPFERLEQGEQILTADVMDSLGVGTSYDRQRYAQRSSNWYTSRVYRDTRVASADHPYALWQLHVTYYTGALDTVPHVPDTCLVQGGYEITDRRAVTLDVPSAGAQWGPKLTVRRTSYQSLRDPFSAPLSQYYVFSFNGQPESDWWKVRQGLANIFVRHCYFAKIQVLPLTAGRGGGDDIDRRTQEFLDAVLPAVLEALPTPQDVQALSSNDGQ